MTKRRMITAAAGAAAFTLCAVGLHLSPLALARLALLGAALGAVVESDLAQRRIPNRIVVPAAVACAALWVAGGIVPFALIDGVVLVVVLLALSLCRSQALGMGDVKLALLLVLGLDGRGVLALLVALALAACFGVLLVVRHGRAGGSRQLPLAPFFAAGALIALLA
ncbi:MAG: prepilin peptidase [Actinobacteria bacterium]|nr:prepilin peptidase [Actinomycetota bacterium]